MVETTYKIEHIYYVCETDCYIRSTLTHKQLGALIQHIERALVHTGDIDVRDNAYDDPRVVARILSRLFDIPIYSSANGEAPTVLNVHFFCSSGCFRADKAFTRNLLATYEVSAQKIISAYQLAVASVLEEDKHIFPQLSQLQLYKLFMRQVAEQWHLLYITLCDRTLSLEGQTGMSREALMTVLKAAYYQLTEISDKAPSLERMDQARRLVKNMTLVLFPALRSSVFCVDFEGWLDAIRN